MKAIVWTRFGPPNVLQLQEVAKPAPRDNEVLIRTYATTVSPAECELRGLKVPIVLKLPLRIYMGLMRPKPVILGQELAGEIEAVGKEVARFKEGDQVSAWCGLRLGGYAEYACLPSSAVMAIKPSGMSFEEAATLPVGGLDATYFIRRANIRSGERVLINGAGGCIGTYAVQIARYFGAEVTAVDSTTKLDMLRSIGADHVVDYTREDFTQGSLQGRRRATYDVIFDVVGKSSFSRGVRLLTPNGRYLSGNGWSQQIRGRWMSRRSSKKFIPWAGRTASEYADDFNFLKALFEAGKIRAVIDKCYPLEQTAEAHRYVERGHKKGHVVIRVQSKPGGNS
jgi:NADPH:quinone reductase-like Zn-dependent oxidoreductase